MFFGSKKETQRRASSSSLSLAISCANGKKREAIESSKHLATIEEQKGFVFLIFSLFESIYFASTEHLDFSHIDCLVRIPRR